MTASRFPHSDESTLDLRSEEGLLRVLTSIDSMAAQRPVAARIVTATNSDDVSARELSRLLATDVALAGRVMKLANSATFAMRGRVDSLQFAVTVVGFTTVRTMATVALTDLTDESRLPPDFWTTTTQLALAAASVAPRLGQRSQDALCVGLLAELGTALLSHNDPQGYGPTVGDLPTFAMRRSAEKRRYGIPAIELSALALDRWSFPMTVLTPMQQIEAVGSLDGAVLRVSYEVVSRLAAQDHVPQSIARISCGRLSEKDIARLLNQVDQEAEELRVAILGE
jgi:HD-like signal output (HDOD) protein